MRKIVTVLFMMILFIGSMHSIAHATTEQLNLQYDGQNYVYQNRSVSVVINGHEVQTGEMPAIIFNSRTLVPAREVFESEAFNAEVQWNGEKKEVYITYQDNIIVLQINSSVALVNNESVQMDVPAKLIMDTSKNCSKTMIPLRFVSEHLDFDVDWDGENYIAYLNNIVQENNENSQNENITDDDVEVDNQEDSNNNQEEPAEEPTEESTEEPVQAEENSNSDDTISVDDLETLESVESGSANRPLPTPLKDNPIKWLVDEGELKDLAQYYKEESIKEEKHPITDITQVEYYINDQEEGFQICASSEISSIEHVVWNKKLIVDIHNSNWKIDKYEKAYDDNPLVYGVRSSQFSENPKITRVVFDLKDEGFKYSFYLSDDRTKLNVKAISNTIFEINLSQDELGDYIKLHGFKSPDVNVFRLSHPHRIVFDLPNTRTMFKYESADAQGQYVKSIRTAQFNETTTRIVVETDGQADYHITKASDTSTLIRIIEPSYNNFQYHNMDRLAIKLKKVEGIALDLSKIKHEDNYLENEYIITLPGDYTSVYGSGEVKINDGNIHSVLIDNDEQGITRLTIKQNNLYSYKVTEDDDYLYMMAYQPKELYSTIIVVDAGHGGKDCGANKNGLYEKKLNLEMVHYLKAYLDQNPNIKTYYTRLDDTYPTLPERADLANAVGADLFLSVHNNSFGTKAKGTETLYYPSCPAHPSGLTAKKAASIFQEYLLASLGTYDRGLKQRDDLYVLKNTKMPSVLLEIAFLSNAQDAAKLKDANFNKKASKAMYDALIDLFNQYPTGR